MEIERLREVDDEARDWRVDAKEREAETLDGAVVHGDLAVGTFEDGFGEVEDEAIGIGDAVRSGDDGGGDGDGDGDAVGLGANVDSANGGLGSCSGIRRGRVRGRIRRGGLIWRGHHGGLRDGGRFEAGADEERKKSRAGSGNHKIPLAWKVAFIVPPKGWAGGLPKRTAKIGARRHFSESYF